MIDIHRDRRNLIEQLSKAAGIVVVFLQAGNIALKGVDAGSGENAGLPHAPSVHPSGPTELLDDRPVIRHNQGADRCPEALRETKGDGIEVACVLCSRDTGGNDGVEKSGAVEVHGNAVGLGYGAGPFDLGERIDGAASAIMGVLQAN